jgi:hypothetical protein
MEGLLSPVKVLLPSALVVAALLSLMTALDSVKANMAVPYFVVTEAHAGVLQHTAVQPVNDAPPAADDTGRNARDRDGMTMTPLDQSNDPDDVNITRKIRKALVADNALSTTAKNIKIITVNGKVILRGPVANVQEKKKIGKTAQKFTKQRVLNELEVAAQ